MQSNLVTQLEFVWNPVLIMALLVLGIDFLRDIMDLLLDVLNPFNKPGFFVSLHVSMRRFIMCGFKGKSYTNGAQWLKLQGILKRDVANRTMKGLVRVMLYIRKEVIPHVWMFGVLHL